MDKIIALLLSEYNIISNSISPIRGGFSANAYRVAGADGVEYFLKEYDKSLPTTRLFADRIDAYMPALSLLSMSTALRGRVLTPIPARNGAYKTEKDGFVYALFLHVSGETPGIRDMTREQTTELAGILALLHDEGGIVPSETPGLAEDISLPFCDRLIRYLDNAEQDELFGIISPHIGLLRAAISETLRLRDAVRLGYSPLVLCHGDAHGNNVIQSERLVLVDWEGLCLAPAEADLFIYAWHTHGEAFLKAYSAARRGYCINYDLNHDLLRFYVLRRRIEDIWVDVQRLTEESPDEAERTKLLGWVRQGIEEIRAF